MVGNEIEADGGASWTILNKNKRKCLSVFQL